MKATQPDKPLVFLSRSAKDAQWSNDLQSRLLLYADEIECWDHSQLNASANWDDQIKGVLGRASMAVVFLSRAYLASRETGEYELHVLEDYAKTNGLKLFRRGRFPNSFTGK